MKKILTICVFAAALLVSSQGFAQLTPAVNAENSTAKQDVKNITAALGLNEEQSYEVSKLYIKKEKALNSGKTLDKAKMNEKFIEAMKGILTEQQFARFKTMK